MNAQMEAISKCGLRATPSLEREGGLFVLSVGGKKNAVPQTVHAKEKKFSVSAKDLTDANLTARHFAP